MCLHQDINYRQLQLILPQATANHADPTHPERPGGTEVVWSM